MVSSLYSLLQRQPLDTYITQPLQSNHLQDFGYLPDSKFHSHTNGGVYVDLGAKIDNGVVWFWLLEKWQDLPNELWAWKYVTVWTAGHYHFGRSIWLPSLLLFDFWAYDRSSYPLQKWASNPQAVIPIVERPPVTFATTFIAPILFKLLRSSGDSRLARTCRLVCRDWARKCTVRQPMDFNWRVEDGIVWHWVETNWRVLPIKLWAWTLFSDEWWIERRCHQRWFPKLLQPVDSESIDRNVKYPLALALPPSRTGTSKPPDFLTPRTLPPELFQYICDAADGGSWSSRLVCRYWNRQCTPHVLRQIDAQQSPERIRALWRHRADPTFVRHLKVIENVPWYRKESKFPWIHLLSQTCTSTQSVWKSRWGVTSEITIFGPFSGGHRSMRSVHFALPRSPPRALSRGIKKLHLDVQIHFRRYEDLLHAVCELPDLEMLSCLASFGSLPAELPRRRPRTNRNKLRKCWFKDSLGRGATPELIYTPGTLEIALYLSVYDTASFFSEAEVVPILSLLKASHTPVGFTTCYSHDLQHHSRRLDFDCNPPFLALNILRDAESHVHTTLDVGIDCRYEQPRKEESEDWEQDYWKDWKQTDADAKFREDTAPLRHARFVLGFYDRKELKYFVKTVLEEDPPAIFRDTTLRYGIWDEKAVEVGLKDEDGDDYIGAWRQASLDSEELTGKPRHKLLDLYG